MIYQDYIDLYKKYTQKYGSKTAIFLMVGSFYELYDTQHKHTGETQTNIREITDLLGIQISIKKSSNIPPNTDIIFAGFPDYSIHKWAGRLTSSGWTVVVVDQIKNKHGSVQERQISRILSPSTHIENISSIDTPYVFSIFFHQQLSQPPLFGAGALDLTTGTTITYSGITNGRPDIWTADELVQMMSIFQPKELLIYWKSPYSMPDETSIRRIFGLLLNIPIHIYKVESLGTFSNELACTEYLQKIYYIHSLLPPKTYLGLRSDQEQIALLYLLQFIEEHYPTMLKSFHRNEPWIPQSRLICGNHTLTQLQITGLNPNETVIGLFDKCITSMGKRAIRDRILSPYSDSYRIKSRLNEVKEYMEWTEQKTKQLEIQLRFMFDLPRLHRKLLCGLITSQEISGLFQTYSAINNIIISITPGTLLKEPFSQDEWNKYNIIFQTHFVETKSKLASDDITSFNPETYPDIGNTEQEITKILNEFQILRSEIADIGGVPKDAINIESHGKEPYGFKGSTAILKHLSSRMGLNATGPRANISKLPAGIKISELKSGGWIDCTQLQQLNTKIQKLREKLVNLVHIHLLDACKSISDAGQNIWHIMECWISHIDCTQCISRVSKEKGFTCPVILDNNEDQGTDDNGSSFEIEQIRHPLVESSSSRISYVKHNIELGGDNSKGWLVYGMNASGKSTLMKATGVCILLAQAGCFVPAKSMKLKPFQAIYTRILNQDNLFAGLSSFAVEMSELRDILRNANSNTLVLGDELCAGTESISAQSLVASSIQWLSARNAKFVFATHLHGLSDLLDTILPDKSTYRNCVKICHLHVEYDPITKKLIYDRSLREGSGSTLYGLEVARAMDLPFEFIEQALQNRHRIIGSKRQEDVSNSVWNKEIIKKECEICKMQICSELEVHHIAPRASATNNILEDGSHMNDKRNLIVICQKCHDQVHAEVLEIGPLQITSDGPERIIKEHIIEIKDESAHLDIIEVKNDKKVKRSKWSEDEMKIVKDTLQTYSSLSLKSIRAHLSSKYSISISEGILGKIRKDTY